MTRTSLTISLGMVWAALALPEAHGQVPIPFSLAEKEQILESFNDLRSTTAGGMQPGASGNLPSASNMNFLLWDEGLANVASAWASTCTIGFNPNRGIELQAQAAAGVTRFNGPGPFVGETPFFSGAAPGFARALDGLNVWASESSSWTYGTYQGSDSCSLTTCGNFAQMAWATTRYVGCGMADCTGVSGFRTHFFCNYVNSGLIPGQFPYAAAPPCTACDPDRTECVDSTLCGGCPDPNFVCGACGPGTPPDFCPDVIPLCSDGCDAFDQCLDTSAALDVECNVSTNLCEGATQTCGAFGVCEAAQCVAEPIPAAGPTGRLWLLLGLVMIGAGAAARLRRA